MFYDMTQESCVVFVGIGHLGQTSTNIGGIFLFFFFLVLIVFPWGSPSSQDVPLRHSQEYLRFIPYGLPKVQLSYVYK